VADGDLADHDACLEGGAAEHLPGHDDHAKAIATTFLVIVGVFLGGDQTLSRRTINEGGLLQVCNHRV
jgi:hypothetical protein